MAGGVVFGRPPSLLLQPGSYTLVDASALAYSAPFAWNLVFVAGAALGGTPMTPYAFNDPYQALQVFGVGSPLTDGIRMAFRGGSRGGSQGGAPVVIAMRVDNTEQARGSLAAANGGPGLEAIFKDFGGYGNTYALSFYPGSVAGYMAVLEGQFLDGRDFRQVIDNESSFSRLVRRINEETPINLTVTSGGERADQTIQIATSQLDGRANVTYAGDPDPVVLSTDTYGYQYPASLLQNSVDSFLITWDGSLPAELPTEVMIADSLPADFNGTFPITGSQAAYQKIIANTQITATAYGADVYRWKLQAGTWGAGLARIGQIFEIATGPRAGTYQILHFEYDGLAADTTRTVRKLATYAQAEGAVATLTLDFWPSFRLNKTQPAQKALASLEPGNGQLPRGGHYLTVVVGPADDESTVYLSTEIGDNIEGVAQRLTNLINQSEEMARYVVASFSYNSETYTATITLTAVEYGIDPNLYGVKLLTNVQTELLGTTNGNTLTGGIDPPPPMDAQGNITGSLFFAGGFDSVPTYQRWLECIEAIKYVHLRYMVPLTDNIGVQAAFADHAELSSSTPKRRERVAIVGHGLGWNLDKVKQRSEFFNSERVCFVTPGIQTDDGLTGNLRMYPSFYTAAQVAGIAAAEGNGITDPITHTFLRNVNRLEKYFHSGSLELDSLIQAGALVIERDPPLTRPSQGFRVVRGITTWRISRPSGFKSNLFEELSHLNQSDYIAQRIRQLTEDLFVGRPLLPEVLDEIRITVNLELLRLATEKVMWGYMEKATRVSINQTNQTALDVYYEVMIAPSLNFILAHQMLIPIPRLQASVGGTSGRLPQNVGQV
jgi:hypothetical protein